MHMFKRAGDAPGTGRRSLRFAGAISALMLLAVACGNGDDSAEEVADGGDAADATEASADGDDVVEITMWYGREDYNPADDFEAFHDQYPNIRVTWDVIPLEQAPTDFIRAHDAGNAPDIVNISAEQIPALAQGGYVRDVTEELARWQEEEPELYDSLFDPLAIEAASWDGTPYGVALYVGPEWYVYRIDLLEEAGFDGPAETWEELIEIARATTDGDNYGFTQVFSRNQGFQTGPLTVFMAMGGEHDDQNYPILDSDAGIEWLEFYQTMMREGLIDPETLAWDSGDKRAAFIGGRASQGLISQNILGRINDEFEYGVEWAATTPPVSEGREEQFSHKARAWSWLVSSDTEHPYEASLVLRYLAETENLEEVALRYLPSTSQTVLDGEAYGSLPWIADISDDFVAAEFMPVSARQGEMGEIGIDAMQEAVLNPDADAAEIAARFQAEIDELRE